MVLDCQLAKRSHLKILHTLYFTLGYLSPICFCRTMQDMENPQVTSCNKGDQHYRSSPSNQSSSSDPGPCGSSTWSQQPGYDGYRTTAVLPLLLKIFNPGIHGFGVTNTAAISPGTIPWNLQFCKMTAIFHI